jgi:hypothetical protein
MPSSSEVEGTPAELGQPADVEQLARGAVRPRGVEGDRTGVADGGRYHADKALVGEKSKEQNLIILKNRAGEVASGECAGIYIDAIVANLGLAYWRMTVNHNFPKASLVAEKIFSDPEKVFGALVGQGNSRPHAGVYEKVIAQRKGQRQRG